MTTDCKVTELFCIIDEFCKHFDAENAGNLLEDNSGVKRRRRAASLSDSEMCHGDWSMASPPTCQEVIDVTSTRPLSKDFDVKRFGLNTTSHKSVCLQVCLYTSQADQDIQCQRNNT